jgi:hypothetical protein
MIVRFLIRVWLENRSHNWLHTVLGFVRTLADLEFVLETVSTNGDANDMAYVALYLQWASDHNLLPTE